VTIASDVTTANSTIETALETIEAQLLILEADHASDPQTFNSVGGASAAGTLIKRMYEIGLRANALHRSTS